MIDSIEIKNFQSHKYTLLEFHPGLNIIKGESHEGKSAIFRAIKWALLNRPQGFGFKSHFSDPKESTICSIGFDDGSWISRERNNKDNYYTWGTPDQDDNDPLKAIRSDIPDEIFSISRIDEKNLRGQGDGYFILGDSPGQAGKKLNKIIGLGVINEVITKANQIVSKAQTRLNVCQEDIKDTSEKIEGLNHVPILKPLFNKIDSLQEERENKLNRLQEIEAVLSSIKKSQEIVEDNRIWLQGVSPYYNRLQVLLEKYGDKKQIVFKIRSLLNRIERSQNTIGRAKVFLKAEKKIIKLRELIDKRRDLRSKRITILNICQSIQKSKQSILAMNKAGKRLELKKAELVSKKIELEKQLDYCPKCGAHRKYWRKDGLIFR